MGDESHDVSTGIAEDARNACGSSSLVTKLRFWLADENSTLGNNALVGFLGNARVRIPCGLTFASFGGVFTIKGWRSEWQLKRWPQAFGSRLLPTTLLGRLRQGLSNPNAVRIFISRKLDIKYCVIINKDESPVAVARRVIVCRRNEVFHHTLIVDQRYQGRGLASTLLASAVSLYSDLNITAIRLIAGLSAGGMVWPKFGFRPESESDWMRMHGGIRQNLKEVDVRVKDHFQALSGHSLDSFVENLLSTGGPKDIWGLSDLDQRWPRVPDSTIGLGSFLLRKLRWRGILDLQDARAMARLRNRLDRLGKAGPE